MAGYLAIGIYTRSHAYRIASHVLHAHSISRERAFYCHRTPALSVCVERAPCPRCLAPVAKLFSDEAAGLLIQFRPRTRDCTDGTSAEVSWFTPAVPAHILPLCAPHACRGQTPEDIDAVNKYRLANSLP